MRLKKVRAALEGGDVIMIQVPSAAHNGTRRIYTLVRAGKPLSEVTFQKLLPELRPRNDGLFGAETSQTYELA